MVRTVIDVDERGNARPLVAACECRNWSGSPEWCDAAVRDPMLHHPSCELWDATRYAQTLARIGDDPSGQGFRDDVRRKFQGSKFLTDLADAVAGTIAFITRSPAIVVGVYALYKLAGPATTYAASRSGAKAGARAAARRKPRKKRRK